MITNILFEKRNRKLFKMLEHLLYCIFSLCVFDTLSHAQRLRCLAQNVLICVLIVSVYLLLYLLDVFLTFFSCDVVSGFVITPCVKINKPLVKFI